MVWELGYPMHVLFRQLPLGDLTTPTLLDAGANGGFSTSLLARLWPTANIIALEPDAGNFGVLVANTARRHPRVLPLRAALWQSDRESLRVSSGASDGREWNRVVRDDEKEDEKDFDPFDLAAASPAAEAAGAPGEVRGVDAGSLLSQLCLRRFDLIKMDIEGAETAILRPGVRLPWLARARFVFVETHGEGRGLPRGSERQVLAALAAHNMSVVATFPKRQWWEHTFLACAGGWARDCRQLCQAAYRNRRVASTQCGASGLRCCRDVTEWARSK